MPKATRKGDIGSGHGCFPPSPAIEGSPDVFINNQLAVRVDDAFAAHGCGVCVPHGRTAAVGSATVNINGKAAVRIGDTIDCGGSAASGSSDVFIGDLSWGGKESLPIKAKMRLFVTQTPGSNAHPYTQEPYKLFYNGGLVQQGKTDDEGIIEYEYDASSPLKGELKVECRFIEMKIQIKALPPIESFDGVRHRLDTLGYYDKDGQEQSFTTGTGKSCHQYFQGDQGENVDGERSQALIQKLKPLLP